MTGAEVPLKSSSLVTGESPLLAGACQVRVTVEPVAVAVMLTGAVGRVVDAPAIRAVGADRGQQGVEVGAGAGGGVPVVVSGDGLHVLGGAVYRVDVAHGAVRVEVVADRQRGEEFLESVHGSRRRRGVARAGGGRWGGQDLPGCPR